MSLRRWGIETLGFGALDLLNGTRYRHHLAHARDLATWDAARLHNHQIAKLDAQLARATSDSPYYASLGIPADSDPIRRLARFPVLTKARLREVGDGLLTVPKTGLSRSMTSGSSGFQSTVYLTPDELAQCRAIIVSWWEWTGFTLGTPLLQTGMTPSRGLLKGLKDAVTRTTYVNAFGMSRDDILRALAPFEGTRGAYLGGYAASLYVLAAAAREAGLDVRFEGAISWGDKMFPHYQREIEQVFRARVFENYSTAEMTYIGQKKDLPYFYHYTPNIYLELVDDAGQAVPDGQMGRVLVTKLDAVAMPLIRYELGDLAVMLPKDRYPATRDLQFPLIERVIGRDTDLVKTPEGKILIVHTFTGVFEYFPQVQQFKVVQRELEEIEIQYVPAPQFDTGVLEAIERELRVKAGTALGIRWTEVRSIAPSASGKPQIIESHLIGNRLG
jgi:phenylacetate-CoA ligase